MTPPKKNPGDNAHQQSLPLQWDSNDASMEDESVDATPDRPVEPDDMSLPDPPVEPEASPDDNAASATPEEALVPVAVPDAEKKRGDKPGDVRVGARRRRISLIKSSIGEGVEITDDFEVKVARADALPEVVSAVDSADKTGVGEEPGVPDFSDEDVTLGQVMLDARGARNLSLLQVSQATKIPKDLLEDLENEAYHELPVPVYCRSYIRQLCRLYHLAPEPCLDEYERIVNNLHRGRSEPAELRLHEEERGLPMSTYNPEAMHQYVDTGPGWMSRLPRLAVMGAIALLVILVAVALVSQQVRAWRERSSGDVAVPVDEQVADAPSVDFTEFIVPEQLPMRELPIP